MIYIFLIFLFFKGFFFFIFVYKIEMVNIFYRKCLFVYKVVFIKYLEINILLNIVLINGYLK